jgi:hypothetical protein
MVSGAPNHFSSACRSLGSKLIAKSALIERWARLAAQGMIRHVRSRVCPAFGPRRKKSWLGGSWLPTSSLSKSCLFHLSADAVCFVGRRIGYRRSTNGRCMDLSFARRDRRSRRQCRFTLPNLGIVLRALTGVMPKMCRAPLQFSPSRPVLGSLSMVDTGLKDRSWAPQQLVPSFLHVKARS